MYPIRCSCLQLSALFVLLAAPVPGLRGGEAKGPPDWVEAMKKVHARFKGTPGTLALTVVQPAGRRQMPGNAYLRGLRR